MGWRAEGLAGGGRLVMVWSRRKMTMLEILAAAGIRIRGLRLLAFGSRPLGRCVCLMVHLYWLLQLIPLVH